eukprot:gnl/TRDRNA2_/TRDRNA2_73511_c0_seq1.p1 gnl/TRDRNA2_/TRDRNA2_73511_c0~~gnl/TRDRNA2_/TRDRNA2_73511_c0_seq1.p1  ORF type:complete len:472 (+),score=59.75 gnl/TRDRNA2_/TRDRNA2_73511_c0_seq1:79-1494(+)
MGADDTMKISGRLKAHANLNVLSQNDFRSLCAAEDANFTVYEGLVLNLKDFKHPGDKYALGKSILQRFHEQDITEWFNLAHGADARARKVMNARVVARLSDPQALLSSADKDLQQLRERYVAEGRFSLKTDRLLDFFRKFQPFILLTLGLAAWPWWMGEVTLFLGWVKLFWWFHDVMHDSVMPNGKWRDATADFLGILLYVVPFKDTGRTHMVHHAFTNWLDLDTAIRQSSPFQFHTSHLNRSPSWFVRVQIFVFFGVALPMYPIYLLLKKLTGQPHLSPLIILRFLVGLWINQWALIWMPVMAGGFCAFCASLNHFHMEMLLPESKPHSFVHAMAMPTQNVDGGPVWRWLCGGLDSHIEHHLFPALPHQELPGVRSDVQDLLSRHGIAYNSLPLLSVIKRLVLRLKDPYADHGIQLDSVSDMWDKLSCLAMAADQDSQAPGTEDENIRRASENGEVVVTAEAGADGETVE